MIPSARAGGPAASRDTLRSAVNLLLFEPGEVLDSGVVTLSGDRARHVREVLRAAPGQLLRVGVLDGPYGTGRVEAVDGSGVTLSCAFEREAPPRPAVDLLLALPRPKVLRRLWAQLAAIGTGRIMLTNADRVERNYFDTHILRPDVYGPLLVEGLQQARDTRVPRVSVHRSFRILVEDELDTLSDAQLRLVSHPGTDRPVTSAAGSGRGARVLLAVGPEGGWNAFELELLAHAGFIAVSMGARTLRSDTACIALLAVVHAALASALTTPARGALDR